MPEASIGGARDPERNKDDHYEAFDQGMAALVRALVKFERWEELLKPGAIPWRELPSDKNLRAFPRRWRTSARASSSTPDSA